MSETTPGFDRRNAWLYMNAVAALLLASKEKTIRFKLPW